MTTTTTTKKSNTLPSQDQRGMKRCLIQDDPSADQDDHPSFRMSSIDHDPTSNIKKQKTATTRMSNRDQDKDLSSSSFSCCTSSGTAVEDGCPFEIQALNLMGVEFILQGQLANAVLIESQALTSLSKSGRTSSGCSGVSHSSSKTTRDEALVGDQPETPKKHWPSSPQASSSSSSSFENLKFFSANESEPFNEFFLHPFVFEYEEKDGGGDADARRERAASLTMCCLFNLGLAFHLQWRRRACDRTTTTTTDDAMLLKAAQTYEKALAQLPPPHQWRLGHDDDTDCSDGFGWRVHPHNSILKLLMALCANLTQCYAELHQPRRGAYWNGKLQDIFAFWQEATDDDTDAEDNDEEDEEWMNNEFFHAHAMCNSMPTTASAA